jgi:hypothetical protein
MCIKLTRDKIGSALKDHTKGLQTKKAFLQLENRENE